MRKSTNDTVRILFTNLLTRTGNLAESMDVTIAEKNAPAKEGKRRASKWNAALVADKQAHV